MSSYANIRVAAQGSTSGTLEDWPSLRNDLRELGIDLPVYTGMGAVSAICRLVPVPPMDPTPILDGFQFGDGILGEVTNNE